MDRQVLSTIRFYAARWVSRLTWPWLAAMGVLVFCAGIFLSVIMPAQRELHALHQQLLALQLQVSGRGSARPAAIHPSSLTQLAIFYDYFPAEQSVPDWLEKIHDIAKENALLLKQGDYRITRDKGGKLLRYQVKLPLNGSYLNIRKFISALLVEVPTASLDNVTFERQKISDSAINGTIELTLYFGRPS